MDEFGALISASNRFASDRVPLAKLTALAVTACGLAGFQRISTSRGTWYREHYSHYGGGFEAR